jgi:hypothetical protein
VVQHTLLAVPGLGRREDHGGHLLPELAHLAG